MIEAAVCEPIQAGVVGANPERTIAHGVKHRDRERAAVDSRSHIGVPFSIR